MAIPFLNNINLSDNELQNAKLHVTSTVPAAEAGQIYFNSTQNVARYHNGTTWVDIPRKISVDGTDLAYSQAIDLVAGTNVGIAESSGVITISSTDEFEGTVKSVDTGNSTFIDGSGGPITNSGSLTFSLSATGTPNNTTYLRGDNTWSPVSGIYAWDIAGDTGSETIVNGDTVEFAGGTNVTTAYDSGTNTLTINSTDQFQGTLTGITEGPGITVTPSATSPTVAVDYLGADNYLLEAGAATVADSDDIINFSDDTDTNVKKTTLGTIPVESLTLVKNYIDSSASGGVYYQGGYNPTTDLTSPGNYGLQTPPNPNIIEIGWMYTVTADGTFFGEQLRVGDVLIAEIDAPTSLADWTTVQNNIDLATSLVVGLGNVVPGSSNTITAPYSNGTATLDVVDSTPSQKGAVIVDAGTGISVSYTSGTATVTNTDTNLNNTYAVTISDTATITHGLLTKDVIIQLYDFVTNETVYADVVRVNTSPYNTATITFSATPTNDVRVLVQKIG